MNNEKGSALLTTMIIVVIFTILGLSLLSFSLSGAKKTEVRETDIEINTKDLTNLKEGISLIESQVRELNQYHGPGNEDNYNSFIEEFITYFEKYKKQEGLTYSIINVTDEFAADIGTSSTRVFQVKSGKYKQNVYITAMPSFLNYALGARGTLTINGSVAIDGDIYANKALNISNAANYIYKSSNKTQDATFPSFVSFKTDSDGAESVGEVSIEKDTISKYCSQQKDCYDKDFYPTTGMWSNLENFQNAFNKGTAVAIPDDIQYIDVDLENSFIEKLIKIGFHKELFNQGNTIPDVLKNNYETYISNGTLTLVTDFKDIQSTLGPDSFYYEPKKDEETILVDADKLELDKDDWLIINGNVVFESPGDSIMPIHANMLITGDVTFKGNFNLESVTYSLGENATFNNVNITNNDATFILITDGKLEFARVNKFDNNNLGNIINGFLYTTKNAEVYGVGSLININGGIFSRGDLTVNAFQGSASAGDSEINFTDSASLKDSRLKVKNDKRLFLNQLDALPRVDRVEVIPDRIEKTN